MGRKPQVSWSPRAISPRGACHKDLRHLEATARPPCPREVQQGQTSRLTATWRQCSDGRPDSREQRATQSQSGTWEYLRTWPRGGMAQALLFLLHDVRSALTGGERLRTAALVPALRRYTSPAGFQSHLCMVSVHALHEV